MKSTVRPSRSGSLPASRWATFAVAPQADFPLRPGYSVQFFARARKEGENALAGLSTRRLVQVATTRVS